MELITVTVDIALMLVMAISESSEISRVARERKAAGAAVIEESLCC